MVVIGVDDEDGARKLLGKAINANIIDETVELFSSVSEALKFSKTTKPDVAFLDINMPEMTGIEFAKKLKKINPKINIIFVTGYSEYAPVAFSMHASGYLTKPVTAKDVKRELENLRNPILPDSSGVYINTFGNFDVMNNGHHVTFQRGPAKEVLAYLVCKKGAAVSRKELAAVLFEDAEYTRSNQSYMTQILNNLVKTLKEEKIDNIIDFSYNNFAINPNAFKCDAYEYAKGNVEAINAFDGEFMIQYAWAEEYIGQFY